MASAARPQWATIHGLAVKHAHAAFHCGRSRRGCWCHTPTRYRDDFRCGGINASNLEKVADALVSLGLRDLGYVYLSLDDCWARSRNPATGVIEPDPAMFPDGMKSVVDYVHGKGVAPALSVANAGMFSFRSRAMVVCWFLCFGACGALQASSLEPTPIVASTPASGGPDPLATRH